MVFVFDGGVVDEADVARMVFADGEIVGGVPYLAQGREKVKPSLTDRLAAALDAVEQGVTASCERKLLSGRLPWQAARDPEIVRPPRENHRVTTVVEERTQSRVSELIDVLRAAETDWRRCYARMLDVVSQLEAERAGAAAGFGTTARLLACPPLQPNSPPAPSGPPRSG